VRHCGGASSKIIWPTFASPFITHINRINKMAPKRPSPVQPNAMPWPIFEKLKDKRVVLASSSPRRKDILANVVS